MTVRVAGEPKCPGCCIALAGVAITFNEGWAWCPVCTNEKLWTNSHLRYVLQHDIMQRCAIMSHGLRFYLPTPIDGELPNAIDCFEKLVNEPETRQAAITAWPGFNLQQLPQETRDRNKPCSAVYARDVRIPTGWEIAGVSDTGQIVLIEIQEAEKIVAQTLGTMPWPD